MSEFTEAVSRPRSSIAEVSTMYPQYREVYAVCRGYVPGIYYRWSDCKLQGKGFLGARYKGFKSIVEVEEWLRSGV
jgi:hypothetical protein